MERQDAAARLDLEADLDARAALQSEYDEALVQRQSHMAAYTLTTNRIERSTTLMDAFAVSGALREWNVRRCERRGAGGAQCVGGRDAFHGGGLGKPRGRLCARGNVP